MSNVRECQILCLPRFSDGSIDVAPEPLTIRTKRTHARPWNFHAKWWYKRFACAIEDSSKRAKRQNSIWSDTKNSIPEICLHPGDWVQVRSRDEIKATLNLWNELKGCTFLEYMWQYCGTTQQVLQPMECYLDERDHKVKKVNGIVLLRDVICRGTPVFGRCDRCCHLFWRVEWLERIIPKSIDNLVYENVY